jgi:predicted ester cyclase
MATALTDDTSAAPLQDQLERGLQGFPERWLPRVGELHALLTRWEAGWNTHDLDLLETAVTEDVVWDDPAMFGETVHGRGEFRAFTEILFRAIPDVHFEDAGQPHLALQGTGLALPWRMTGTFTGELAFWGKRYGSQPPTWAPTGRRLDIEGVDLYEFRDGLISHWKIVYDVYGLMQQIGLLPPADRPIPSLVLRAQRLIASRQRRG